MKKQSSVTQGAGGQTPHKQQKKYVMTTLRENGQWEPLTAEEMAEFERVYPDIAKFWQDPALLESLDVPARGAETAAPILESWDLAAKRLMNKLWKVQNAWIFHEPVDAEKLEIPDYYDVVT